MRKFIMADIHGGHKAMMQCFERSGFDREKDELIVLGDVVDGWPETRQCVDELLKIKNLVFIIGNHDFWALNWAKEDDREYMWISQGGWNTLLSYDFKMPEEHVKFFENANLWMEDEETNTLFVHGGVDPNRPVETHRADNLMWNRDLIQYAKKIHTREKLRAHDTNKEFVRPKITQYNEVFIGHTSTSFFGTTDPIHYCNVWLLDTGGGWEGKLTIMDFDTREYWQSDTVSDLYKGCEGRREISRYTTEAERWLNYEDKRRDSV